MSNAQEKVLTGELLDAVTITSMIPSKFNAVAAGLEDIKERYTGLKISGSGDTKGYEAVRLAIADVREKRVAVEKFRKIFKQPLLEIGKAIDSEAGRITSMLESIEQPLKIEKSAVDDEKAIAKAKKEAEERALIEEEQRKIAEAIKAEAEARAAEQAEKMRLIEEENAKLKAKQAENDRIAKEEAEAVKAIADAEKKKADEELAQQRAEIAKMKAEQEAQSLKIAEQERAIAKAAQEKADAEAKAIADEKARVEALAKAEADRLASEAKEKADAEAKELQDKLLAEQAEKELAERLALQKELAPDYEILGAFASTLDLSKNIDLNDITHPIAIEFKNEIRNDLIAIINKIYEFTGEGK